MHTLYVVFGGRGPPQLAEVPAEPSTPAPAAPAAAPVVAAARAAARAPAPAAAPARAGGHERFGKRRRRQRRGRDDRQRRNRHRPGGHGGDGGIDTGTAGTGGIDTGTAGTGGIGTGTAGTGVVTGAAGTTGGPGTADRRARRVAAVARATSATAAARSAAPAHPRPRRRRVGLRRPRVRRRWLIACERSRALFMIGTRAALGLALGLASLAAACTRIRKASLDAAVCAAGQAACGHRCVDSRPDPTNCGGCGIPCSAGQSCARPALASARPASLVQRRLRARRQPRASARGKHRSRW